MSVYAPGVQGQAAKPVLPPASSTGTGFGGGVKRFIFGLLLMGFLETLGLLQLHRRFVDVDPMIVIYSIVGCAGVQGLLILAWLNYTAARLTGVRHTTAKGGLASAVLAAMLAVAGWWGGTMLQTLTLPEVINPYTWAIPPVLAGLGYWIAVKLGFKAGIPRTFLTTLVGFGLPVAAVLAAGKYVPQQAIERTEPLRMLVRQGLAGLNMFNLDQELRKYRVEHQDNLPTNLNDLLPPGAENRPHVANLWPAARVRDGMVLIEAWQNYASGKPVSDFAPLNDLLLAYADPTEVTACTQPAEMEKQGRWVLMANGTVSWSSAEDFGKRLLSTRETLQKGPKQSDERSAPAATSPTERAVPLPTPSNKQGQSDRPAKQESGEPAFFGI